MSQTHNEFGHKLAGLCEEDQRTTNALARELPKYNKEIADDLVRSNPWARFFNQSSWEDGAAVKKVLVFHKAELPDDPSVWARSDTCSGRSCHWEYQTVNIGQSEETAILHRSGLRTKNICLEELRDKKSFLRIVQAHLMSFRDNGSLLLGRFSKHSHAMTATNFIAAPGFPHQKGGPPANVIPQSILTIKMLEHFATIKTDLSVPNSGETQGKELFPMMIGEEAYRKLKDTDPCYKDMLLELDPGVYNEGVITREGMRMNAIGNFVPIIVREPDRADFNFATGELELVQPKLTIDAPGGGEMSIRNPAWTTAPYEAVDFPSRKAGEIEVTMSIGAIGEYRFSPQNYTLQPMWTQCPQNIEGNEGFIRGKAERAFVPCFPHYSQRVWVERCGYDLGQMFVRGKGYGPLAPEQETMLILSCCLGEMPDQLIVSLGKAVPDEWLDGLQLTLKKQGSPNKTIRFVRHVPHPDCEHRYVVEGVGCPLTCGCGEKAQICAPLDPQAIACTGEADCGCGCVALEGVAFVDPAPEGCVTALTIEGLKGEEGDVVTLSLQGGGTVGGVLNAEGQVCLQQILPAGCEVCAFEVAPAGPDALNCYPLEICGQVIKSFSDDIGNALGGAVIATVSTGNTAIDLNNSVGASVFASTPAGVKYVGDGVPGPLVLDDGTEIAPEACPEC